MSHSFVIVNIDKRQYLDPEKFDTEAAFDHFSIKGNGVLQALSFLTLDSCVAVHTRREVDDYNPQEFEEPIATYNERINGKSYKKFMYAPVLQGRWQGDRIVTAGDGNGTEKYVNDEDILHYTEQTYKNLFRRQRAESSSAVVSSFVSAIIKHKRYPKASLHDFAIYDYTDISTDLIEQMGYYGYGPKRVKHPEERVLDTIYDQVEQDWEVKKSVDVNNNRKLSLHAISPSQLHDMLIDIPSQDELHKFKKWFRQQDILPWQRAMLKYYRWQPAWRNGSVIQLRSISRDPVAREIIANHEYYNPTFIEYFPTVPKYATIMQALQMELIAENKEHLVKYLDIHTKPKEEKHLRRIELE